MGRNTGIGVERHVNVINAIQIFVVVVEKRQLNQMVTIPGGEIELRDDRKSLVWRVDIQPFLLAKYPVTQDIYFAIAKKAPSSFKGDRNPVEGVSWNDAICFCNLLSKESGLAEYYTLLSAGKDVICNMEANGYRLPSEAEWQFVCQAGTTRARYGVPGYKPASRSPCVSNRRPWFSSGKVLLTSNLTVVPTQRFNMLKPIILLITLFSIISGNAQTNFHIVYRDNSFMPVSELLNTIFSTNEIVFLGESHRIKQQVQLVCSMIPILQKQDVHVLFSEFANYADTRSADSLLMANLSALNRTGRAHGFIINIPVKLLPW